MKQSLQLKLNQQLRLTPQLQQAIRFLQLSSIELQQELQLALENNPLIELGSQEFSSADTNISTASHSEKETDFQTTAQTTDMPSISLNDDSIAAALDDNYNSHHETIDSSQTYNNNDFTSYTRANYDFITSKDSYSESLQDHLRWQLNLTNLSTRDRLMAEYIIDATDSKGRLSVEPVILFESINYEDIDNPLEFEEFEAVRHLIQQFTPVGSACANLQECLIAQINPRLYPKEVFNALNKLLQDHFDLLTAHDRKKISRLTHIKEPYLSKALSVIKQLNPYPGNCIDSTQTSYVIPDIIAYKHNHNWCVRLNEDNLFTLKLNNRYIDILNANKNTETQGYLKQNLPEAKHLIQSLDNRNQTLLRVGQELVNIQQEFFSKGDSAIKPLTQQKIAQALNLHESTISRITTQKYILTPFGTLELKYFFSSQLGSNESAHSAKSIQATIKQLITNEDSKKPLSDTKIAQQLLDQGISIARRTISKYREQMCIPPSNERKNYIN